MSENIEPPRIYPTFRYKNAAKMIDWIVDAFGFTVHARYADANGVIQHAQLAFGSSMVMVGNVRDDDYGRMVGGPGTQGGKSAYVAADDPDGIYERAKAAGAKILEEPTNRDYGSRDFVCADPEGNVWSFGTYWPKAHEPAL